MTERKRGWRPGPLEKGPSRKLTPEEVAERLKLFESDKRPPCLWWLSFADTNTKKNVGVMIVEAPNLLLATRRCHQFARIPMNTSIAGWPIPAEEDVRHRPHINMLMNRAALLESGLIDEHQPQ